MTTQTHEIGRSLDGIEPLAEASLKTQPASPGTGAAEAPEALVYTVEEAAAVLRVHPKTIRRLLARRYLSCCKVLRKKLIPKKQIEAFLKATCEPPKATA